MRARVSTTRGSNVRFLVFKNYKKRSRVHSFRQIALPTGILMLAFVAQPRVAQADAIKWTVTPGTQTVLEDRGHSSVDFKMEDNTPGPGVTVVSVGTGVVGPGANTDGKDEVANAVLTANTCTKGLVLKFGMNSCTFTVQFDVNDRDVDDVVDKKNDFGTWDVLGKAEFKGFLPVQVKAVVNVSDCGAKHSSPTSQDDVCFLPTPEPGSLTLWGSCLFGLAGVLVNRFVRG